MTTEIYAYQVALKTLKERCDYLQNKLELAEEENCQLKLRLLQDDAKVSSRSILDGDQSQLQITLLKEQKAKLNHQVQLITSENQKLWKRLSKFAFVSDNFDKASMKEQTLKYFDGNVSYIDDCSDLDLSKITASPECSKESLEEISLKLNTLVMDKKGAISEFPGSMDLCVYKNLVQMENCAFSSPDNNLPLLNSFKDHIVKLKQFKQILHNNKCDLANSINLLKNFQKNWYCNGCGKTDTNCDGNSSRTILLKRKHNHGIPKLDIDDGVRDINVEDFEDSEKICPMCEVSFTCSVAEFHMHVTDHFSDDESDIKNSFEILP